MSGTLLRRLVLAAPFVVATQAVAAPRTDVLAMPPQPQTEGALGGQIIYLNRCIGGCDIHLGAEDATNNTSPIPKNPATFPEPVWMPGEWDQIVQCVREVYSPYDVMITDQRPSAVFNEVIVAGDPGSIGNDPSSGGVASVSLDCSPRTNSVAFVFASAIDVFAQEDANNRVWGTCWTIAQESAHLYGLDHEFQFLSNMRSACSDPMTYLSDCGGQKFFRNQAASCGEFGPARPGCGPTNGCASAQNSHQKLLNVLGPGTPITTPPVTSISLPAAGATIGNGTAVHALARAQRGIGKVELWINGYRWGSAPGVPFGSAGQPESDYGIVIPAGVPDSILDIQIKAFDDINVEGDSAVVTVTKGAAGGCQSASTCAKGQKCDAGKCYWDPPTGQLGDTCGYNQFCQSDLCQGTADKQICTQTCLVGVTDPCPTGFDCVPTSGGNGICFPPDAGGCCSVGHEPNAMDPTNPATWIHGGLAAFVLGLVMRRRRRR
jgi:MYXO-CTERM domain-containing protein